MAVEGNNPSVDKTNFNVETLKNIAETRTLNESSLSDDGFQEIDARDERAFVRAPSQLHTADRD